MMNALQIFIYNRRLTRILKRMDALTNRRNFRMSNEGGNKLTSMKIMLRRQMMEVTKQTRSSFWFCLV